MHEPQNTSLLQSGYKPGTTCITAFAGQIRIESFLVQFCREQLIYILGLKSFTKNYMNSFELFVDGTFDTVPFPLKQLYSIPAEINGDIIPIQQLRQRDIHTP